MKLFNNITATVLVTALGMAWSSQAYSDLYTIHKVSNFTVKFDRQVGDSIEREKVTKKDTLEFLLNGESSKKRILVAIVECDLTDEDDLETLEFEFGVWDKSTKQLLETELLEWSVRKAVSEMKGNKLNSTVQADNDNDELFGELFNNFDQDLEFQGRIVYRELKSKLIPNGVDPEDAFCVHTIKSFSMGDDGDADDGGTTDNIVTGGKLKIGKPIDAFFVDNL